MLIIHSFYFTNSFILFLKLKGDVKADDLNNHLLDLYTSLSYYV